MNSNLRHVYPGKHPMQRILSVFLAFNLAILALADANAVDNYVANDAARTLYSDCFVMGQVETGCYVGGCGATLGTGCGKFEPAGAVNSTTCPSGVMSPLNGGRSAGLITSTTYNVNYPFYGWVCGAQLSAATKNNGQPSCTSPSSPNPINAGTGNKYWSDTDYRADGVGGVAFNRQYNSRDGGQMGPLGVGWHHGYERTITDGVIENNISVTLVARNNGVVYPFTVSGSTYVSQNADVTDRLTRLVDGSNSTTGWTYYVAGSDSTETYSAAGKLISIQDRAGFVQTLTYSDSTTPVSIAPRVGMLISVTDTFGRKISFTYNFAGRMTSMTDPAGNQYTYAYDASTSHLATVTYPDGKVKGYLYGEAAYTSSTSLPHALTGIVDEKGIRYASYYYDAQARAFSSQHAGGVDQYQITYNAGNSIITDPLGTSRTYNTQSILGVIKTTNNSQPGGSGCGASSSAYTYDANGNIASRTDFNGNRTNYSYDLSRNLEPSRIEGLTSAGATTAATRTITTTWHPTYRIPATITEPTSVGDRVTTFGFDNSNGNILSKTVTVNGSTRSWSWTYDSYGRVLTSTDPRGKVTTDTYYPNTT